MSAKAMAQRAVDAAWAADPGLSAVTSTLAGDLAVTGAPPVPDAVPRTQTPTEIEQAVRAQTTVHWESGTAEAYHARKHMRELPPGEQSSTDVIEAYRRSLQLTIASGTVLTNAEAGASRLLIFQRTGTG